MIKQSYQIIIKQQSSHLKNTSFNKKDALSASFGHPHFYGQNMMFSVNTFYKKSMKFIYFCKNQKKRILLLTILLLFFCF